MLQTGSPEHRCPGLGLPSERLNPAGTPWRAMVTASEPREAPEHRQNPGEMQQKPAPGSWMSSEVSQAVVASGLAGPQPPATTISQERVTAHQKHGLNVLPASPPSHPTGVASSRIPAGPTLGDTTLMSSLRKRNLPTSSWKRLPQLFMQDSSTWGERRVSRFGICLPQKTGFPHSAL